MTKRRSWISLSDYQARYGAIDYTVPDWRADKRTCKWCRRQLNGRQESFCSPDCRDAWHGVFTWGRGRPAVVWRVLCRDDFKCQLCGEVGWFVNEYDIVLPSPECLDVHHKVPVADGGTDHIDNLVTLCRDCHKMIHNVLRR